MALLAAGAVCSFLNVFPVYVTKPLDAAAMAHWKGQGYAVSVVALLPKRPELDLLVDLDFDWGDRPLGSPLRVLEEGRKVGLPHAIHQDIADKGGGRYSHWGHDLLFSASDNSNPITNGRTYAVRYPLAPAQWVCLLLISAGVAGLGIVMRHAPEPERGSKLHRLAGAMFRHRHWLFWAGAALLVVHANAIFHQMLSAPIFTPDTAGYLEWSLVRTLGYPMLLHAYLAAFGAWDWLAIVQLNLVLGGLLVLAYGVCRATGSYVLGWLVLAITFGVGNMILLASEMMTEAAFSAFLMAHVGSLLVFIEGGRRRWALLAGICLAAAVLVKSVAVVLIGPLMLLILFLRNARARLAVFTFAPALMAWLGPSTFNLVRDGVFESSIAGGLALGGHVAWAIRPQPGSPYQVEAALIERRLAPELAKRPARFASRNEYIDFTTNEYNTLLWVHVIPELRAHYEKLYPRQAGGPCTWSQGCATNVSVRLSNALVHLSREAIASNPWAYAYHVAAHDYGLWRYAFYRHVDVDLVHGANARAEYLPESHDPARIGSQVLLPPDHKFRRRDARVELVGALEDRWDTRALQLLSFRESADGLAKAGTRHPLVLFGFGLAGSVLVFWLARLPAAGVAFCYCGLAVNAYFLGTALAQPTLSRYAWTMQGLLVAMLLLGLWLALGGLGRMVRAAWKRRADAH